MIWKTTDHSLMALILPHALLFIGHNTQTFLWDTHLQNRVQPIPIPGYLYTRGRLS